MSYTDIEYKVIGSAALLTLNRPEKLNAFTYHTPKEIREAVDASVQNPDVVGIVITGNGRGFSSGLDSAVLASVTSGETATTSAEASDELPGYFLPAGDTQARNFSHQWRGRRRRVNSGVDERYPYCIKGCSTDNGIRRLVS